MKCIAYCRRCGFTSSLEEADVPEWRGKSCQNCWGPIRLTRCSIRIAL